MRNGLIVYADGTKEWWLNGKRHRKNGPAVEDIDGYKEWFLNGKLHRKNGPAVEFFDEFKAWFLNGREYTEEEHKKLTQKKEFLRRPRRKEMNYYTVFYDTNYTPCKIVIVKAENKAMAERIVLENNSSFFNVIVTDFEMDDLNIVVPEGRLLQKVS